MEAYLQKKRRRPLFLDGIEEEGGEDEVVAVATADVQAAADGGATPKPAAKPSSGTATKRRHAIYQFKASRPSNGNSTPKTPKTTKSVVAMLRRTPEQIVDQRRAKDFQPTIESSTKTKEEKQYMDLQWALWFMECGVSFNTANSRQFEIALNRNNNQYGSEKIEDIGKDNVVQFVTDNGANYKATGKFYPLVKANDDATVGQLRGCFIEVLGRMIPDVETQMKINRQAIEYEEQRGDAFSNKMAKESYDKMSPLDWWHSYGGLAIELQRLVKRIVSLCASSSDCERSLSTFNFGRNLPRRATATQYYSRSRNVLLLTIALEDGEEEDEVEDPHDDAEVSECEDGNVLATEEDKAVDPDEFDDRF
ncbi:unnamed protein product [Miscanthus lutarioriparius]|uniref:HAT C-terminal dimerisation domain-containing protein n=1 Tax=Miscanthus lutarioriparius TaxID=422564 RepID=A0A811R2E1_9POAL|nr:unnamed protein product [Miscanthus lutarioriparius]